MELTKKRNSSSEVQFVKNYLYQYIEDNNLSTGDQLPTEKWLSTQLSSLREISVGSIRLAYKSLSDIGLIETKNKRYTLAKQFDKPLVDLLKGISLVSKDARRDLGEVREALDNQIFQRMKKDGVGLSKTDIVYLEEQLNTMRTYSAINQDGTVDERKCTIADTNFHKRIAEKSANIFIRSLYCALAANYREFIMIAWDKITIDESRQLIDVHQHILDGFKNQDASIAREAIGSHYQLANRIITNHMSLSKSAEEKIIDVINSLQQEGENKQQIKIFLQKYTDNM